MPLNRCAVAAAILLAASARADAAGGAPPVTVGPNVRISEAHADRLHHEVTMAASPTDPGRLLACAMVFDARDASRHVICYLTKDGGRSWTPTIEVDASTFVGDPTIAFGPAGEAYLAALALHYESAADHETLVYRSEDGGATWSKPTILPFIDREWLVVDQTPGPRRGTLYMHGNAVRDATVDGDERIVFTFYRSTDGGKTFSEPKKLLPDGEHMSFGTGTSVVLTDGTFLASFPEWSDRKNLLNDDFKKPEGAIKVVRSSDGGSTLEKAVKVADWHSCQGWTPGLPVLASDASDGPFRDRLYVTWPDRRSGRCEILFSSSKDKGATWTPALTINDDQAPVDRQNGRNHMLPAVAVNAAGVVGVSWSDRRNAAEETRQWTQRFAASLDGGETFTPSVALSPDPPPAPDPSYMPIMAHSMGGGNRRPRGRGGNLRMEIGPQWIDYLTGADTAGMSADAGGAFHPLWIDNRDGVPQVYTAAVRVEGRGQINGSPELAALADVTQSVAVDFANTAWDAKTKTVSLDVTLVNTSERTLLAPLKVRIIGMSSSVAVARALDTENGVTEAGGVWDFSRDLPGGRLGPGQATKPRRLRFRVDALGPFRLDKRGGLGGLISLETKVLAKEESK
jgi:hypothetical protein